MPLRRTLGVAVLAALLAPAAAVAGATASFNVRPGHFDAADPATRAYFKRTVAPQGSFTDSVVVANNSSSPITLLVYPVDGLTGQTSGSVYANRGVARRKAGAWIQTALSRITVPPAAERAVRFTARVPAGAAPGDHLGGIAFEDANVATSSGAFRVRQILREVLGVLIRVPGPAQPRLRLGEVSLQALVGTNFGSVLIRIGNGGRLLCKPKLSVTLASRGRREQIRRQLDTILPGDTIAYPLILHHDLKPAAYAIQTRASCASSTVMANGTVDLKSPLRGDPKHPPAQAATVIKVTHSGLSVWVVAGVATLTALSGAAVGWVLHQRRKPV